MNRPTLLERFCLPFVSNRRRRHQFTAAVIPLEDRRLLSNVPGLDPSSAVMTQTAWFPNIQTNPTLSDQAILFFSPTMGTLKEVDVVTTGLFTAQFGTGATSVKVNSISPTAQATEFTDSAHLAAFTGSFRIPLSVAPSSSAGDPTATIIVKYYFAPSLPSLDPAPSPALSPTPTSATSPIGASSTVPPSPSGTVQGTNTLPATGSTHHGLSSGHLKTNASVKKSAPFHPVVHPVGHHLHARHPRLAVEHHLATRAHVARTR
jgi:hypothetical protein